MPDIALTAELRTGKGSPASRRERVEGRIPAVVYGHGHDPLSISVDAREFRNALVHSSGSVLFNLSVDAEQHLVIAREIQRHPVRHSVSHIDFQVVSRDEVIPADVPIHLIGTAQKVTRAGGMVEHALTSLHLRAKPGDIPAAIEVDIEDLEIGTTIRIADLKIPAGVVTDHLDPDTAVVVAAGPHAVDLGEDVAAEGEETAEGAAEAEAEDAAEATTDESSDEN